MVSVPATLVAGTFFHAGIDGGRDAQADFLRPVGACFYLKKIRESAFLCVSLRALREIFVSLPNALTASLRLRSAPSY